MQKHKTWHHCPSTKEINAYLTRAIAYSGAKHPQVQPTTFTFDPKLSVSFHTILHIRADRRVDKKKTGSEPVQ